MEEEYRLIDEFESIERKLYSRMFKVRRALGSRAAGVEHARMKSGQANLL